jgi:hypothetical protein
MPQPSPMLGSPPTAPRWSRFSRISRALLDDRMALAVLHVRDEADAARVALVRRIVEALRLRHVGIAHDQRRREILVRRARSFDAVQMRAHHVSCIRLPRWQHTVSGDDPPECRKALGRPLPHFTFGGRPRPVRARSRGRLAGSLARARPHRPLHAGVGHVSFDRNGECHGTKDPGGRSRVWTAPLS